MSAKKKPDPRKRVPKAVIVAELEKLQSRSGRLTPVDVVEAAEDEAHPLHPLFTWDDSEAAAKFRLEEARTLIRSVEVSVITDEKAVQVVAYVRDPKAKAEEQGYIATMAARQNKATAKQVLQGELQRIEDLLHRAEDLAEVFGMRDAVSQMAHRVRVLRDQIA